MKSLAKSKAALQCMLEVADASHILFGSDFPNIPYPVSHAVMSIGQLPLKPETKRAMLFHNAARLYNLNGSANGGGAGAL